MPKASLSIFNFVGLSLLFQRARHRGAQATKPILQQIVSRSLLDAFGGALIAEVSGDDNKWRLQAALSKMV